MKFSNPVEFEGSKESLQRKKFEKWGARINTGGSFFELRLPLTFNLNMGGAFIFHQQRALLLLEDAAGALWLKAVLCQASQLSVKLTEGSTHLGFMSWPRDASSISNTWDTHDHCVNQSQCGEICPECLLSSWFCHQMKREDITVMCASPSLREDEAANGKRCKQM